MVVEFAVLILLLLAVALAAWRRQRRRTQLERLERRSHRLYLRTQRDNWLRKWLYGSRVKRLTDQRPLHPGVQTDQTS
jgi:Flp pilus assembly protein TadB